MHNAQLQLLEEKLKLIEVKMKMKMKMKSDLHLPLLSYELDSSYIY